MSINLRKSVTRGIVAFMIAQFAVGVFVITEVQRAKNVQRFRAKIAAAIDRIEGRLNTDKAELAYQLSTFFQMPETTAVLTHPNPLEAAELPSALRIMDRFISMDLDLLVLADKEGRTRLFLCDQELIPWRERKEIYMPDTPVQINDTETHSSILLPKKAVTEAGTVYLGRIFDSQDLKSLLDSDMEGMIWIEKANDVVYTRKPAERPTNWESPDQGGPAGQDVPEPDITWLPQLEYREKDGSQPRYYGGAKMVDQVNYLAAARSEEDEGSMLWRSILLFLVCLMLITLFVIIGRRWATSIERRIGGTDQQSK